MFRQGQYPVNHPFFASDNMANLVGYPEPAAYAFLVVLTFLHIRKTVGGEVVGAAVGAVVGALVSAVAEVVLHRQR